MKKNAIFDGGVSVGGTWALERLHPDLDSNDLLGTFEYPDFPIQISSTLELISPWLRPSRLPCQVHIALWSQ